MDMVADLVDLDQWRIGILQNAGDIGMELTPFHVPQKLAAVFRAKDKMDDDVGQGLRHCGGVVALLQSLECLKGMVTRTFSPGFNISGLRP